MFSRTRLPVTRVADRIFSQRCKASTLIAKYEESVAALPYREAAYYKTIGDGKWSATNFKSQVDAHANALLEYDFKTGDTIGVWLPESPHKHVIFMVAAKMGMKVVELDLNFSQVSEIRQVLAGAKLKSLYFESMSETQNNLLLLRKSIPELYHFDDTYGKEFHSKYYPELRWFLHMNAFEEKLGCLSFDNLRVFPPHNAVDDVAATLSDSLPLYTNVTKGEKGPVFGPTLTHGEVFKQSAWSFADKLIKKEHFIVETGCLMVDA